MRRMWLGGTAFLAVLAVLAVLAACSDATKPVDPATVVSFSVSPSDVGVLKGARKSLTLSALDSSGNRVRIDARWTSSDSSVATISSDGTVTGVDYGSATIFAWIGSQMTRAHVVVTGLPTARTYSVADLGAAASISGRIARQLDDSGDVISGPGATLYRGGAATTLSGCVSWVAINGPGHVLCRTSSADSVSGYAIWRDGTLTPLAAVDTFKASDFHAFAMNDSDEVAGLFYMPSFTNASCQPTSSTRCLAIWKGGDVSFPAYNALNDVMLMNSRHQVVLESPIWYEDGAQQSLIRDVPSGAQRYAPWGVHALNEGGWGAGGTPYVYHAPYESASVASVTSPGRGWTLGQGGATGINNANVVVGTLYIGPFIWRGQGVSLLTDAAIDPTWTIRSASEINNRGQILATADNADGRKARTVLLTPTQP